MGFPALCEARRWLFGPPGATTIILDISLIVAYASPRGEEDLFLKEDMMGKRKVLRNGLVLAAIFAVAVFASSGSVMAASKNCSHLGTWHGAVDTGATYMVTITKSQSTTVGQMVVEWVLWDPTINGNFTAAVRTTNPMGVWEKVSGKKFMWTWIAYGLAADGSVVYQLRTSGVASMTDCDTMPFNYVTEVFIPLLDTPVATFCGEGTETRMQLVQTDCPN